MSRNSRMSYDIDVDVTTLNRDSFKKPNCRACTDFKSWRKQNQATKKDSEEPQPANQSNVQPVEPTNCPLDVEQLGRNTWSFLHTMAAYYPDNPSPSEQKDMMTFITLFSKLYPCHHCASDFRQSITKYRPDVSSRRNLSLWWCEQHNLVNAKLEKPIFDCSKTLERWGDGWADGSCD